MWDIIPLAERDKEDGVGRNCSGKEREGFGCNGSCEGDLECAREDEISQIGDTRTAEPCVFQLRVDARRNHRPTHVRSTKLRIYPGCFGEYLQVEHQKGFAMSTRLRAL